MPAPPLSPPPAPEVDPARTAAALRGEIREILSTAGVAEARRVRDPRPVHRALGAAGLLAPQWPVAYGGRGTSHVAAAVLVEELAQHDVPDLLHTLTVQIVGTTLLTAASPQMCARYLPGFAAGSSFACVLFSEPHAGSDLAALATRAVRDGDRYRLHGVKTHSIFARLADVGLCLARTGDDDTLTLFLVPLRSPGVTIRPVRALGDDDFHEVTLDGVEVGDDAVVGQVGQGWAMLVQTLLFERTGLDYYAKGLRWHREAARRLAAGASAQDTAGLARLGVYLHAAGLLVRRVLTRLDTGELTEAEAAVAKWYTTELAAQVAWWAAERQGDQALVAADGELADPLDAALRDAPSLRISGGTSEMMLETVARMRLDSQAEVRS